MILYNPINGDVPQYNYKLLPRTCFIMTKLGSNIPKIVTQIREKVELLLYKNNYNVIDAEKKRTGRDFLQKIWEIIISVPIGIAILYTGIPNKTLGNIFYEIGLMQATGKEVVIIKDKDFVIPSDFIRTEYLLYDENFDEEFTKMIDAWNETAQHYLNIASYVANNPLLSLDYLRRAYLLTGEKEIINQKNNLVKEAGFNEKAKNSVEGLMANFK